MKQQVVKISENELNRIISESVMRIVNENIADMEMDTMVDEDSVNEGLLGMAAGAILDNVVLQKIVDFIADMLHLDKNGVLYRVLSSKLFAMSLGNEIQNSIKLNKQNKQLLGQAKQGDGNALKSLLGFGGVVAGGKVLGNLMGNGGGQQGLGQKLGGMLGGGANGGNTVTKSRYIG